MSGSATAVAQRGAAGLFGGLAGLRRGRPLHPAGVAFEATLSVEGAPWPGAALFERPGTYAARVRFSRGFGLPEPLPEILSLAVKVRDAYGPGSDQDVLVTASGERPGLRHTFAWGRSDLAHRYSSVIPFTMAGQTVVLGAVPRAQPVAGIGDLAELVARAEQGALALDLQAATLRGPWTTLGRLAVGRRLDEAEERGLTFNSDTTGGGIAAPGWINGLRGAAYDASARVRPTE